MADEEGRERRGEDLFEDLDKFFAPIQDVDWPEPSEEEAAAPESEAAPEPPAPQEPPAPPPAAPTSRLACEVSP